MGIENIGAKHVVFGGIFGSFRHRGGHELLDEGMEFELTLFRITSREQLWRCRLFARFGCYTKWIMLLAATTVPFPMPKSA